MEVGVEQDLYNETAKRIAQTFDNDQQLVLLQFQNQQSPAVNRILKGREPGDALQSGENPWELAEKLRNLMAQSGIELPHGLLLFSGVRSSTEAEVLLALRPGEPYANPGLVSLSLSADTAYAFAMPNPYWKNYSNSIVLYEIGDVGPKALLPPPGGHEKELILAPNTKTILKDKYSVKLRDGRQYSIFHLLTK
jgi:hypothetical protein